MPARTRYSFQTISEGEETQRLYDDSVHDVLKRNVHLDSPMKYTQVFGKCYSPPHTEEKKVMLYEERQRESYEDSIEPRRGRSAGHLR